MMENTDPNKQLCDQRNQETRDKFEEIDSKIRKLTASFLELSAAVAEVTQKFQELTLGESDEDR